LAFRSLVKSAWARRNAIRSLRGVGSILVVTHIIGREARFTFDSKGDRMIRGYDFRSGHRFRSNRSSSSRKFTMVALRTLLRGKMALQPETMHEAIRIARTLECG